VAMPVMHIGLVPRLDGYEIPHDGMIRGHGRRGENTAAMPGEPAADQPDEGIRMPEARGRAMDRQETATALDVVDQGLLLFRRERVPVRVQQERVELLEKVGTQRLPEVLTVGEIDASGADGLLQDAVARD